jgi:hypothetical protein
MSGYCKTGAQANKPHFHEMLMRHTPDDPLPPISEGTWGHQMSGVAISWLLVKRAKDAILRRINNSVRNELCEWPHLKYSGRGFWTVDVFCISIDRAREWMVYLGYGIAVSLNFKMMFLLINVVSNKKAVD